jgi:hypothetical protein
VHSDAFYCNALGWSWHVPAVFCGAQNLDSKRSRADHRGQGKKKNPPKRVGEDAAALLAAAIDHGKIS